MIQCILSALDDYIIISVIYVNNINMKKKLLTISILLTTIIISFFFYKKYQQEKTTEEKVANIAVDKIIERDENDEMLQFVREFLNDSTIQIVDAEKGILRKDSICFFYDTKWDTYLVVPDSFILEIPEDHSSLNLIYDDTEIKTWTAPRDEDIWKGDKNMKNILIEAGILVEDLIMTDSIFILSFDSKKEDTSYYFYLKIKPLSDDTDLFISYQTLSEYKQDAIIRNVIKQFPDKPF